MSFTLQYCPPCRPLCKIIWPGYAQNNKIVYLSDVAPPAKEKERKVINEHLYRQLPVDKRLFGHYGESAFDMVGGEDFFQTTPKSGQVMRRQDMELMRDALDAADELDENDEELFAEVDRAGTRKLMQKKFKEAKAEIPLRQRDFSLDAAGHVEILADPHARECIFLAGMARSGKTFWAATYIRSYNAEFPEHPIVVISPPEQAEKDPAYAEMHDFLEFIDVTDEKFAEKCKALKAENCLVVFDDCDSIETTNKPVFLAIHQLRARLLEVGRHKNVYVINTSHNMMAHGKTKAANTEATAVVLFPKGGNAYHITTYLRVYCGLSPAQMKKIKSLGSRWVMISRTSPQFVLYERGAYFLEIDDDEKAKEAEAQKKEEKKEAKKAASHKGSKRRMFD